MLPSTPPKETLLACTPFSRWNLPSFTVESIFFSSCSDLPLSRLPSLSTLLRSGAMDRRLCFFSFWLRRLWRTYQLLSLRGTETSLSSPAEPVQSFSAEACAILQTLFWSRQRRQICHFSSPIRLSFCPRHSVLFSIFPFASISLADLTGTVFSLLLFYQATMGPHTLVSFEERRG